MLIKLLPCCRVRMTTTTTPWLAGTTPPPPGAKLVGDLFRISESLCWSRLDDHSLIVGDELWATRAIHHHPCLGAIRAMGLAKIDRSQRFGVVVFFISFFGGCEVTSVLEPACQRECGDSTDRWAHFSNQRQRRRRPATGRGGSLRIISTLKIPRNSLPWLRLLPGRGVA